MSVRTKEAKPLTGWKVLGMFVLGFGTIIAANMTLAVNAFATFPGVEAKNTYMASQDFDERRHAQEALHWTSSVRLERGELVLDLRDAEGAPIGDAEIGGFVGRPTYAGKDFEPRWRFDGAVWRAPAELMPGNWDLRLKVQRGEDVYVRRLKLATVR
jgi:nitrogen fixation protein FixH